MTVSLRELINRATGGRRLEVGRLFRPSQLYGLLQDPFGAWCDFHAPPEESVDETTSLDRERMDRGIDWENQYVAQRYPSAYRVREPWGEPALHVTLSAMIRGERAIHGASLWLLPQDVYGQADLLIRCDEAPSDLGPYHYRVKEIKHAARVKTHHQLQATAYSWMLGEVQGYRPASFQIVLRAGAGEQVGLIADYSEQLQRLLTTWRRIRDGDYRPEPLAYDSTISPWRRYANRRVVERKDLSLLPGVGPGTAERWRAAGIRSMDDLLAAGAVGCAAKLRTDHGYYHALAHRDGRPVFRPGDVPGIERRRRLIYFDVEDTSLLDPPTVTRPHTYMLGVAAPDGTTRIWTARGERDEARMWSEFLDWLGDPRDAALYCWTRYEQGRLLQAAADHPALAARLAAATAALIDLKEQIKHRPFFRCAATRSRRWRPAAGFTGARTTSTASAPSDSTETGSRAATNRSSRKCDSTTEKTCWRWRPSISTSLRCPRESNRRRGQRCGCLRSTASTAPFALETETAAIASPWTRIASWCAADCAPISSR